MSHFKMLDDGTILFFFQIMYTFIAYTHELLFFSIGLSYSPLELCRGSFNPKSAPMPSSAVHI